MNNNKKDYLLHTIAFQFLVCTISFSLFFGLKITGSGVLESIRSAYFDNLQRNFIIELKENGAEVFNNTPKLDSGESINITAEPTSQPATTNIDKSQSTEKNTVKLSAEIKSTGGSDYSVSDKNDIPDNVSVNSYTLNQKMFLPATGDITSPFGIRTHPIDGELRFHAGIDIADDLGTPIHSAFDGTVIVAEYDQWNGYYLKIIHDNEIMTVYCHCNKLFVKKGDIVKAGQKIAEMGSTGSSTGPHLHFELRINNKSYDPETALNEAISEI